MQFSGGGPGKTAPKLLNDFLFFDPTKAKDLDDNSLTSLGPQAGDGPFSVLSEGSCRHEYTSKLSQCFWPTSSLRNEEKDCKVAVICRKCRIHADIHLSLAQASHVCEPPNLRYPLHHFQREPSHDQRSHKCIRYAWRCSAHKCKALLSITFSTQRLSDADRILLTDTELLRRRFEAIVTEDPSREGVQQARPDQALARIRRYIQDALNPQHVKRKFPSNNKRFMEVCGLQGRDCAEFLTQKLGFKSGLDPETNTHTWWLPDPPALPDRSRADGLSHREYLEDVDYELRAWLFTLHQETRVPAPATFDGWPGADRDIERAFAAQAYQSHAPSRRATNGESAYFASLGILSDFSDPLVEFAFDRQVLCDPTQRPYYYECLQVIAENRNTEKLNMKVATLASEGNISRRDLGAAYKELNIQPAEAQLADDERVLNLYQVLQSDSSPHAQDTQRHALYKIGAARGSQMLINASRQTIETYEDALTWIGNGVDKDTPDESLLAVVAIKADESKNGEETAQKAISIIAKERKSDCLNQWLLGGRSDGYQMTPDEALRHLGVDGTFSAISSDLFPTLFETARSDRPGEQTEKAIMVLEKAIAGALPTSHPPETWPVGLTSHGNTCYLNSLLQYYFSIAPLREIILNYDDYKLDTESLSEKAERVGQRKISIIEIKGGQRFAEDLKHLFERMIKDPREHVKPEEDLVCRAFLEPKDYALLTSAIREEKAAHIPKTKTNDIESAVEDKIAQDSSVTIATNDDVRHESDASSVTLLADSTDTPMKDGNPPLTPPASPGKEKPLTAPPLPPRRFSIGKEEALKKAQDNAKQQQDVTEVHDSIMFRLRSGMMPKGKDASEEQDDALRDLFKIGLAETAVKDGADGIRKELFDSSIQLNVPTEDTDIYSALDAVFDLQAYGENTVDTRLETYKSIKTLPPLLQINIPRIGFDKDGRGGAFKSDKCVKLVNELYLDRYIDDLDADILPKRKSCWSWRKQLHALRKEHEAIFTTNVDLEGPQAMLESAKYLQNLHEISTELDVVGIEGFEVPVELPAALDADAKVQTARLEALRVNIDDIEGKLKDYFSNSQKVKYQLAAVFFHRGNYGHGHYWIYIHDFSTDMWRIYNDERVEEFTKIDDILTANNWQQGTPTYAVYVQDDQKLNFMQPVCRQVERLPTPQPCEQTSADPPWEDIRMESDDAQADQTEPTAIDPKLTVIDEGGDSGWDEKRQVPNAVW